MNLETKFASRFKTHENAIAYLGEDKKRTQFLFTKEINKTPVSFSWKIKKTYNSSLFFGLVDTNQTIKKRTSVDSGHSVSYYALNGAIYHEKGRQMTNVKGAKEGETITMIINPEE